MTPDDGSAQDPEDPQSWNLYSYVENGPVNNIDPDGHDCIYIGNRSAQSLSATIVRGQCLNPNDGGIYVNGTVNADSLSYDGTQLGYSFTAAGGTSGGVIAFGSGDPDNDKILQLAADINHDNPGGFINFFGAQMALNLVTDGLSELAFEESAAMGRSVIGPYPEYVDLARETGASYFSIPIEQWNAMSETERWAANQEFLDEAVARGDIFEIADPSRPVDPNSYLRREIDHLLSRGYRFNPEGTELLPPWSK